MFHDYSYAVCFFIVVLNASLQLVFLFSLRFLGLGITGFKVEIPYYSGSVTAFCMDITLYDLILRNIEGVRAPDNPKPLEEEPKIKSSMIEEPR